MFANTLVLGTIGGAIAALATILGALLFFKKGTGNVRPELNLSIDFALGMMLSAAAFSMIQPASTELSKRGDSSLLGLAFAIAIGAAFITMFEHLLHRFQPNLHGGPIEAAPSSSGSPVFATSPTEGLVLEREARPPLPRSQTMTIAGARTVAIAGPWPFILAMMLHNWPEGLASGTALAGLGFSHSLPILGAIALQNVPEGLTTALAFRALGASDRTAFLGAVASGGVEFIGGVFGGWLIHWVNQTLPFVLGFAGGAMLWVSLRELVPRLAAKTSGTWRSARDAAFGATFMLVMTQILG